MSRGKKKEIRIGLVTGLVIAGLILTMTMPTPVIEHDEKGWHVVWRGNFAQAAEADPGAGASGILGIYFLNHTGTPANTYSINSSSEFETWATANGLGFANADDFYTELDHSTSFNIVVRVRGNDTNCGNGTQFFDGYLRVNITSADLSISALSAMTGVVSRNNSAEPFIWMNFYINNGGSGYNLTRDQTAAITEIRLEAYY